MIRLLAQNPFADTPSVEPLPGAPLWARALLEQPWYLAGALALGAVVVFMLLNQRGRAKLGAGVAAAMVLAGAGVLILGSLVVTQREQMAAASRELVAVTARGDTSALATMLAPDARLFSEIQVAEFRVPEGGFGRDEILDKVGRWIGDNPISECSVGEVQAETLGPGVGRTQVRVRVVLEKYKVAEGSWWRIGWRKSADGRWRVTSIQPLYIAGAGPAR